VEKADLSICSYSEEYTEAFIQSFKAADYSVSHYILNPFCSGQYNIAHYLGGESGSTGSLLARLAVRSLELSRE
jgi:hypothetical protein